MGKFEIIEYLNKLRACSDDRYLTYKEIHEGMKAEGLSYCYSAVWRAVLSLSRDDMLDISWEGDLLKRNPRFRARISPTNQFIQGKKEYNKNDKKKKLG